MKFKTFLNTPSVLMLGFVLVVNTSLAAHKGEVRVDSNHSQSAPQKLKKYPAQSVTINNNKDKNHNIKVAISATSTVTVESRGSSDSNDSQKDRDKDNEKKKDKKNKKDRQFFQKWF